ncbi:family 39 glycosyltransferase [Martensiomyces pterosporus]|nr:family 39 glycosyltransferase [Martensiomyces pterosporus]
MPSPSFVAGAPDTHAEDRDGIDPNRKEARSVDGSAQAFLEPAEFDNADRVFSLALTALCMFTRLYQIGRRSSVSWDETHFGKFGAYYINRTFYHDVHPPLAKMLVGLSEYLSGHNGTFGYKSGEEYPGYVNYTFQRSFVAMMGVMIVPFAYRTCRFLGFDRAFALLAALFVLFDNALCVMSRFILLDQPLLCFTSMSLLGYSAFAAQSAHPFSRKWWRWLAFTGLSLGLVTSSKWVGLFAVALVGLSTIEDLLMLFSDRTVTSMAQAKHWASRAVCLIAVPITVYLVSFKLHFELLNERGTGDFKMPSSFQALQWNSVVSLQPHDVAFGSHITVRSHLPGFGLIHTNTSFRFPDGDEQIVAAGVAGKQKYNWWQIVSLNQTWENTTSPVSHIKDGDLVRLAHVGTRHYLRTGADRPYYMGWDRRVFAGGNETELSAWDIWRIQIADEESPKEKGQLYTVTTTFRLYNSISGCLLQATQTRLPAWARRMSELVCTDSNTTRSEGTLWNIEQVRDKRFERADFGQLVKRRLLRDTVWINREMARSNSHLVADHDRYKQIESDPWSWPFLIYPMRLVSWADDSIKYYEIGNPVLWWASAFFCCLVYPVQMFYWLVRWQRQCSSWRPGEFREFWDISKLLWGGWALHYLPFFLMGRVTYIHHYLPALYFGLLFLAFEIQCLVRWYLPRSAVWPAAAVAAAVAGCTFVLFSPLTFGWDKPARDLAYLRWLPTWNLYEDHNSL